MPPRAGQLDQISESIGEIRAYVHTGRHDISNLTQIVTAQDAAQVKRHADLKEEVSRQIKEGLETMRVEIAAVAVRVARLEESRSRQEGQLSVWQWLVNRWPVAPIIAAILAFIAWANGKVHL
jgi:predicted extracellular nuclease